MPVVMVLHIDARLNSLSCGADQLSKISNCMPVLWTWL